VGTMSAVVSLLTRRSSTPLGTSVPANSREARRVTVPAGCVPPLSSFPARADKAPLPATEP
jgi:hypothetical protein